MNCNDIERILDEADFAKLGSAERAAAAMHRAACRPCAREWEVQERLRSARVPALSSNLAVRCKAAFVATAGTNGRRRAGTNARRRAGMRTAAFGGILFVGAAAAALVGAQLAGLGGGNDDEPESASTAAPWVAEDASASANGEASFERATQAENTAAVGPDAESTTPAGSTRASAGAFVLAVSPLEHEDTDGATFSITESIYAELLSQLRAIPNVTVIDTPFESGPEPIYAARGAEPNPRLTIISRSAFAPRTGAELAAVTESFPPEVTSEFSTALSAAEAGALNVDFVRVEVDPNGQAIFSAQTLAPDESGDVLLERGAIGGVATSGSFVLDRRIAAIGPVGVGPPSTIALPNEGGEAGGQPVDRGYDYRLDIASTSIVDPATGAPRQWLFSVRGSGIDGTVSSFSVGGGPSASVNASASAKQVVDNLRRTVLPASDDLLEGMQTRALDAALSMDARLAALRELRDLRERTGTEGRNDRVLRAAVEMAASAENATDRARVWELLRGVKDESLEQALINSFVYDPEEIVRVEAARTLAADFADQPATRATLERAALSDRSAAIRLEANWAVRDAADYDRYVSDTLTDTRLPHEERIEPLLFALQRSVLPRVLPAGVSAGVSASPQLDDAAAAALVTIVRETEAPQRQRSLLLQLMRVAHPAMTDLYVEMLSNGADEQLRHAAAIALRGRDEPQARAALEQAASSDASPAVRAAASQAVVTPMAFELRQ